MDKHHPNDGPVPLAKDEQEARNRHAANRLSWNEAAARYTEELQQTIRFIQAGRSNFHPVERANLGSLRPWCGRAIHLQCASGRDTLSLWIEGAREVVGVDISDDHIRNARALGKAVNAPAQWFCCDVLDTPRELNATADLVYTGRGSLCWLHDLDAWAKVVARLLKPGGLFHILDDHPFTWMFDPSAETLTPSGINYFGYAEISRGWGANYIGDLGIPLEQMAPKYEQLWTLSQVHQALRNAGLMIEILGEHPHPYWDCLPNLPQPVKANLPLTFSILARKPS